jgi:phosphoserine phosphatase
VAEKIASRYGFDDWLANGVECDENGKLTGEGLLRVELKNKRSALDQLLAKYGIKGDRAACVGDSFVDIPMFEACAMSIAFNPTDSVVVKKATHVVRDRSIKAVLPYILNAEG